jgi:hypothetical protein
VASAARSFLSSTSSQFTSTAHVLWHHYYSHLELRLATNPVKTNIAREMTLQPCSLLIRLRFTFIPP